MSTMIKKTVAAVVIGLALVACGKKDEAPGGTGSASLTGAAAKALGSCHKLTNVGKCTEYDMSKDSLGLNKAGCEATDGKWQATACPTEKQFASCATSETKIFYYAGTTTAGSTITMDDDFPKFDCEMMSGKLTVTGKATPAAAEPAAAPAAPAKKAAPAAAKKK
jgi:hypothetical protein